LSHTHPLRIVFIGTPDFAVASLQAMVEAGYNIVGVITAPDKPAGRGMQLQHSAVKKICPHTGTSPSATG
jgi:methionyl-tRNA formyltransferase